MLYRNPLKRIYMENAQEDQGRPNYLIVGILLAAIAIMMAGIAIAFLGI